MKKLIFLSLMAVMFVSCHRELRKSPDIRIDPPVPTSCRQEGIKVAAMAPYIILFEV